MKKLIQWLPEELALIRAFDAKIDAEGEKSTRQLWYLANKTKIRAQQRAYKERLRAEKEP